MNYISNQDFFVLIKFFHNTFWDFFGEICNAALKFDQNELSSARKASIFQVLEQTYRLLIREAHQANR